MTMTMTQIAPFGAITVYRVISALEGIKNLFIGWMTKQKTIRTLTAMTDRELNDIGITRGDINRVASL